MIAAYPRRHELRRVQRHCRAATRERSSTLAPASARGRGRRGTRIAQPSVSAPFERSEVDLVRRKGGRRVLYRANTKWRSKLSTNGPVRSSATGVAAAPHRNAPNRSRRVESRMRQPRSVEAMGTQTDRNDLTLISTTKSASTPARSHLRRDPTRWDRTTRAKRRRCP